MIRDPKDRAGHGLLQTLPELTPEQKAKAEEARRRYEALLGRDGEREHWQVPVTLDSNEYEWLILALRDRRRRNDLTIQIAMDYETAELAHLDNKMANAVLKKLGEP